MALNTQSILLKCLEYAQFGVSKITGIPTKAIDETIGNINFIRTTVVTTLDDAADVFNALKNTANSFSIIGGMGALIEEEQTATRGFATDKDYVVNTRTSDRYAAFMTISTIITGGEIGDYSGISRGEIVKLDGEIIPDVLGKSLINNMLDIINNFSIAGLGEITEEQISNVILIIDTFKMLILGNISRIAIRINFFSQEDLLAYKDLIAEGFNNFLLDLGTESADGAYGVDIGTDTTPINNREIYNTTEKMREVIINQLIIKSEDYSKSYDYTVPPDIMTTLKLAYDKYEDIERSSEIYNRNREDIIHPGFLPNGNAIRILSV